MSVGKIIVGAVVLVVAVVTMRMKGLSVSDLLQLAKEEIAHSQAETKAVMSGEYTERYARTLREEAAKLPSAPAASNDGIDNELNRELAAERKRIMEQRAEAVQKLTSDMLHGDVDAMKRQVEKQARQRQAGELP